jgi:hypothetical protein
MLATFHETANVWEAKCDFNAKLYNEQIAKEEAIRLAVGYCDQDRENGLDFSQNITGDQIYEIIG